MPSSMAGSTAPRERSGSFNDPRGRGRDPVPSLGPAAVEQVGCIAPGDRCSARWRWSSQKKLQGGWRQQVLWRG